MDNTLCGCGSEGKYVTGISGETPSYSCNKYKRCPTYAELEEIVANYKREKDDLIQIATDLSIFREGTKHYEQALERLLAITNPSANDVASLAKQAIDLINNATSDQLIELCRKFGHEPVVK